MMLFGCGGASDNAFWARAGSVIAAAGTGDAEGAAGAAGESDWVCDDVLLVTARTAFMEIPFTDDK